MYPFLIALVMILFSMPWKPDCVSSVLMMGMVYHEPPCYMGGHEVGGWVGADNRIHLCPGSTVRKDRLLLHESQHLLARLYLNRQDAEDWDGFANMTLRALADGNYSKDEKMQVANMLRSGPQELHAELPWIVCGNLPPELQPWYPWFSISRVGASQEDSTRAVSD